MSNNNYFTFRLFHFQVLSSSLLPLSLLPYSFSCSFAGQEAITSLTRDLIKVSPALQVAPLFNDIISSVGIVFRSLRDSPTDSSLSPAAFQGTCRAFAGRMLICWSC